MTTALIPSPSTAIVLADWQILDELIEAVARTVAESTARIYRQTYNAWVSWCETTDAHPLDFRPALVSGFLKDGDTTAATRQRQLAALRTLAKMYALLDNGNARHRVIYDALKMMRVPRENIGGVERELRALSSADVNRVLAVWHGKTPLHLRNRALIALLFATGLRRAEAAALRWDDIDLKAGTLTVRRGKGYKSRTVAIVGDFALRALSSWHNCTAERQYIFCPLTVKEGIGKDRPISAQAVYRCVVHTAKLSGVSFSPHDARRTHATAALAGGAPIADVQDQLGHAQGATTLRYAKPVAAAQRRKRIKLGYGD